MNKKEFRLVGFLTELVKRYGYTIERYSYRDLENEMKNVTYATIRNYMVDLERLGYLTIERKYVVINNLLPYFSHIIRNDTSTSK